MKLYAWQQNGTHGPLSFFVVAATESDAREAVAAEIERMKQEEPGSWQYDAGGWPGGNYVLTVAEPGTVITNCNE